MPEGGRSKPSNNLCQQSTSNNTIPELFIQVGPVKERTHSWSSTSPFSKSERGVTWRVCGSCFSGRSGKNSCTARRFCLVETAAGGASTSCLIQVKAMRCTEHDERVSDGKKGQRIYETKIVYEPCLRECIYLTGTVAGLPRKVNASEGPATRRSTGHQQHM